MGWGLQIWNFKVHKLHSTKCVPFRRATSGYTGGVKSAIRDADAI
jgi:hypothetical protein